MRNIPIFGTTTSERPGCNFQENPVACIKDYGVDEENRENIRDIQNVSVSCILLGNCQLGLSRCYNMRFLQVTFDVLLLLDVK